MAENQKLLSLLGMCRRAGKLSCGHDSAIGSLRGRSAGLCLLSSDSSERLRKEVRREAAYDGRSIPVAVLSASADEIGRAVGLRSAVLTVNDEGFARTMLGLLNTSGEVNQ